MNLDLLLGLTGFAFVTSATPGPDNMILMALGANFGLRWTVPHMLGVSLGSGRWWHCWGWGGDRMIAGKALLAAAMKWISLIYMVWPDLGKSAPRARPKAGLRPASR